MTAAVIAPIWANSSRERGILLDAAHEAGLHIFENGAVQALGWNGDLLACLARFIVLAEIRLAKEAA